MDMSVQGSGMMRFLDISISRRDGAQVRGMAPAIPPGLLLAELLLMDFDALQDGVAAGVFPVPIFGAVKVPVFAEGGGEGFGEKEEGDCIAARGEVFVLTSPSVRS